jgi:putative transposase
VSAYVDQHRERFGVEPICQTLDVSASAYYQRQAGERSVRAVEDERLVAVIRETHKSTSQSALRSNSATANGYSACC